MVTTSNAGYRGRTLIMAASAHTMCTATKVPLPVQSLMMLCSAPSNPTHLSRWPGATRTSQNMT